ncbi:hypothetical protein BV898_19510 [Hypsibius exemplaris]|uniref:Uncharacterized protein n=1 Tax=Hypsibius exemplaris TaxID=2072580 RepID=A0A9X6NLL1_HYPEX|nr:hypothetical protein BV898_19510 [Hypsibius exemplaris]
MFHGNGRQLRYSYYSCTKELSVDPASRWAEQDGVVSKVFDSSRKNEIIATCAFFPTGMYECYGISECTQGDQNQVDCSGGSAPWRGFYKGTPFTGWRGNVTQSAMHAFPTNARDQPQTGNGETGIIQTCS